MSTLHYTVHTVESTVHSSVSTSIYSVYCTPLRNGPAITSHRVTIRDSPHQHAGSRDKIHRLLTQKNFRRINYPPLAPAPPLRGGGRKCVARSPASPSPWSRHPPPQVGAAGVGQQRNFSCPTCNFVSRQRSSGHAGEMLTTNGGKFSQL